MTQALERGYSLFFLNDQWQKIHLSGRYNAIPTKANLNQSMD